MIGHISVNNSVQFMGVPAQGRESGFLFIWNLQAFVDCTGWGSGKYSNQDWGGIILDTNRITNVAWGASVDPSLAYLPQIPINLHTT